MTELYSASSSVSPLTAILWCLYPISLLVIIELLLGGGFDDDNNDDHSEMNQIKGRIETNMRG